MRNEQGLPNEDRPTPKRLNDLRTIYVDELTKIETEKLPKGQEMAKQHALTSKYLAGLERLRESFLKQKKTEDVKSIVEEWTKVNKEHAHSLWLLGDAYLEGKAEWSVRTNEQQATKLYHEAARRGNLDAQLVVAFYRQRSGRGSSDIIKLLKQAASQTPEDKLFESISSIEAQDMLGSMYWTGSGVTQSSSKAIVWLTKAAEQGSCSSQLTLGTIYDHGDGVPENQKQAVYWYKKAALHDNNEEAKEARQTLAKKGIRVQPPRKSTAKMSNAVNKSASNVTTVQIPATGQKYVYNSWSEAMSKKQQLNKNLTTSMMGMQMSGGEGFATAKSWKVTKDGDKYVVHQ